MMKRILATLAIAVTMSAALGFARLASASVVQNDPVEAKVQGWLRELTLDEKIKLMSGTEDSMHVPGIARLGIPELKFSDGPIGVRCWGKSTAYPAAAMLASTFSADTAQAMGRALGRDARARGVHVLLGPGVDLYRVPQCGRNFEYLGEDPYLSSRMTVSLVKGIQGEGVAACAKHFAANDQEVQRGTINTIVDERRLHEICLAPFKAAVQEANVRTLMCAYNKLNGPWCSASKELLTDILRKQWGFKGLMMSDWGALHDTLSGLDAGCDLEMGSHEYYTADKIKAYIKEGKLTETQMDERVGNVLRVSASMGFADQKQEDKKIPLNDPTSAATSLKVAREGLVLLKNDGGLLPLSRDKLRKIVVLGPNAWPPAITGGGSAYTEPFSSLSLLDAIIDGANKDGAKIDVTHIPWHIGPSPSTFSTIHCRSRFEISPEDGVRGARGEYFDNINLAGKPVVVKTDPFVTFWWGTLKPTEEVSTKAYSVRWTGKIKAPQTDEYDFACESDGARVLLDGKVLFDNWVQAGIKQHSCQRIKLQGGSEHDVVIEYRHLSGPAFMQFAWGKAGKALTLEQEKLIADADVVIAGIGFNAWLESEGFDRSFDLPGDQVDLLHRVARLNPRIVAVLNAGGGVAPHGWLDKVPALIHAWYPGQNGNAAVVEAIFGDLNPSGHLPDSLERKWEDSAAYGNYPGDPADGGTVKYAEGIYVGYRHFDKKNIEPLFPFGYGLSYTTFTMGNMNLHDSTAGKANARFSASVDVTNSGSRSGTEVVQLYVRPIDSAIDRPVQELKGFARVSLAPGETKRVSIPLDASSFALYDVKTRRWISPGGQYEIAFGSSSRDIHCSRTLTYHGSWETSPSR